ncbi:MAG: ferrochelatase [Planctomycetes bacterium]|nr:ferrochelatase [Planctomycetota bacterium]
MIRRRGLLLVNLGTPAAPTTPAVKRYLAEFLSDPRVLDIPALVRAALLRGVILPRRSPRSAEAYRSVWTAQGSPLLVEGRALERALAAELPEHEVVLAMRYGEPSIRAGLAELARRGVDALDVLPLYPQYASSSTGTALEVIYREAAAAWNTPFLRVIPPFYDDPGFLDAWAAVARGVLDEVRPEVVLLSFHGLPERHLKKSAHGPLCLSGPSCCDALTQENRSCYRAQCFATARGLRERLQLAPEASPIAFQSRLGRTPWIRPYTDELLRELRSRGIRRIAVLCPAFVADCLETLEEIAIRAAEEWQHQGGELLRLVPSLNAHPTWVRAAANLLRSL